MRTETDCPETRLLELLMLGRLSDDEAAPVEDHLAECDRCAALVDRLPARDAVLDAMRAPSPILKETEGPALEHLMEQLRGLSLTDTLTGQAEGELLDPPQGPGEVGRVGPYRVLRVLGSGGMGVVYQAAQSRPQRLVALKLSLGRHRPGRLHAETDIAGRLRHPNIVPVYEAGEHRGLPYFTMEFLEGGSLAQKLAPGPLAPRAAAELVRTLALAVQFAHDEGFVHRDLKPANVLLTNDGVPKVSDFGLAKQLEAQEGSPGGQTESGAILGTPGYMAPEQAAGRTREAGPSADVYALGAILYECLTGRPPFRGESVIETLEQVRTLDPVPPRRLRPGLPRDVETICLKCLQKEPSRRYATAAELADDLARLLEGKPIAARPVGMTERLVKWARRRPLLAALVVLLGVSLAALVGGAVVYEQRLRAALVLAQNERQRADDNYREARDALSRILDRARTRNTDGIPALQELRREQQEDALAFFLKIAEQQGGNPEVRFEVAQAQEQAGLLQFMLGRKEESARNLRRAEQAFAGLASEFPDRGLYRFHHVQALKLMGGSVDLPQAERTDYLRRALAVAEGLVREEPGSVPYRAMEADVRITLGTALQYKATMPEAEGHYRRAIDIYEKLSQEQPEARSHRLVLARAYVNLSVLLQTTNRDPKEAHDRAEAALEQLHREKPDDDEVTDSLAVLRINWAYVQQDRRQTDAALVDLAKNVEMLEAVRKREPNHLMARDRLYRTCGVRAGLLEGLKRSREAAEDFKRVVELAPTPANADYYRLFLGMSYARAGEDTLADKTLNDWDSRTTPATPVPELIHCAQVYSKCIGAVKGQARLSTTERDEKVSGYRDRAIEFLKRARKAAGEIMWKLQALELRRDEDLRPLWNDAEFKQLMDAK